MTATKRELESRVRDLERKVEALSEYCAELRDRMMLMAVAKVSEPRFPFFNWQLAHGSSEEDRRKLSLVLGALDDRVEGRDIPPEFRKDIEGVSNDVLYGDQPLTVADAANAIKAVTGVVHDHSLVELIDAIAGQGMVRHLCAFLLEGLEHARMPPDDD